MSMLKRVLVGPPIATSEEHEQRLGKPTALAVFASDAISSTAYATEEILHVLVPLVGMAALGYLTPMSVVVMALLVIVIASYRQTIHAYPSGGGSYVVSRENLGRIPSLVAGASLLVDYVLTVAVSVSAGVAAITSAIPSLRPERVLLCLGFVAVMTVANLRGMKESGRLFAGPTYAYIVSIGVLIVAGLFRYLTGDLDTLPVDTEALREFTGDGALAGLTTMALLRAFSSGAVALTGIEAISNGVPAFRPPESRNASTTLVIMGTILATYFLGISVLANLLKPTLSEDETILSTLGRAVLGDGSVPYYVLQAATFSILILAANTAFADFPRVASILAHDGFLPRQLANRGDRLVFSNGIIALAAVAGGLIVAFGGTTTALIPLYAVGVFTGFTLSQIGMVVHHRRFREPRWKPHMVMNIVGAVATGIVAIVVVTSKFTQGAWIPAVLIPLIVGGFLAVGRHYAKVGGALVVDESARVAPRHAHTVVVLVGSVNRGVLQALSYARSLQPELLVAVSVVTTPEEERRIVDQWRRHEIPVELRTVFSPFRDITEPVLELLDELDDQRPDDVVTVVLPEFVVEHWWDQALHNQSALVLKAALRQRPNTVIASVPVQVGHVRRAQAAATAQASAVRNDPATNPNGDDAR
jgi:amino acid transporter